MGKKLIHTAYVGGPIDLANEATIAKRKRVHDALSSSGVTVYNPKDAFVYGGDGERFIKSVNDFALANADVVLLIFVKDVVSIGTPIELQNARNANKLILVVSPWENTPCYIKALADHIFSDEDQAVKFIIEEVNKCK